jgi:hypothetical protein
MYDFSKFYEKVNTPVGIGIFAGLVTMIYLILMSINPYIPPILLLSATIGYIVYHIQNKSSQATT